MAKKGSNKARSLEQEKHVAQVLGGTYSPSSGAAVTDNGDVRTGYFLVECKTTGQLDKPAKSISVKVKDWDKICDEAWMERRVPMMALRIYAPDSIAADHKGYVDLVAVHLEDMGTFI